MRRIEKSDEPADGMEVDVSADQAQQRLLSAPDSDKQNFQHKNTKAHRFEPKPSRGKFNGNKRGKFSNRGRGRGGGRERNSTQSDAFSDNSSNIPEDFDDKKRKFTSRNVDDDIKPQRKFLKPS